MMMLDSEEDAEEEDSDEEKDMIQNEFKIQKKRFIFILMLILDLLVVLIFR